jgi:hypothetical protein
MKEKITAFTLSTMLIALCVSAEAQQTVKSPSWVFGLGISRSSNVNEYCTSPSFEH